MHSVRQRPRPLFLVATTVALLGAFLTSASAAVECDVTFSVGSAGLLGSLGWTVDYSDAPGLILGSGNSPSCTNLVSGGLGAFQDNDSAKTLSGGLIVEPAVSTPRALAMCRFQGDSVPLAANFVASAEDAADGNVIPIDPLPSVQVTNIECVPAGSTTTTSTSTSVTVTTFPNSTSTTVPSDGCREFSVVFRLTSSSAAVGSLQIGVNYATAGGNFDGLGNDVSCEGLVRDAFAARFDDDASRQLTLGLISISGFSATSNLFQCSFFRTSDGNLSPSDLKISIEDSESPAGNPVSVTVQALVDPAFPSCPPPCGDGVKSALEECDDGNKSNADACLNSCVTAKCGDGFVRFGVEACDDGNNSNTDTCLSSCVAAKCGDGFIRSGVETCDDGNLDNTDACPGTCAAARCGDGYVRSGVEVCDDGNNSNTDACLNTCVSAVCGDGFVRSGTEQCDDGNAVDQDGCSPSCLRGPLCSDPTGDRRVLAGDALRILQRAVNLNVECPDWTCDNNGDGKTSASDALVALTASVGLPVTWKCPAPKAVVLRLISTSTLGSLQLDLDYDELLGDLVGEGAAVQCEGSVPGSIYAFNDKPTRELSMSMANVNGFAGPREIARCKLAPTGIVQMDVLSPVIVDALNPGGISVAGVQVKAVPY